MGFENFKNYCPEKFKFFSRLFKTFAYFGNYLL